MKRTATPGHRQIVHRGPIDLSWIGSWDAPWFPLWGAWRHRDGFTLRFRGWVLVVSHR
jgi:hypothetical protein